MQSTGVAAGRSLPVRGRTCVAVGAGAGPRHRCTTPEPTIRQAGVAQEVDEWPEELNDDYPVPVTHQDVTYWSVDEMVAAGFSRSRAIQLKLAQHADLEHLVLNAPTSQLMKRRVLLAVHRRTVRMRRIMKLVPLWLIRALVYVAVVTCCVFCFLPGFKWFRLTLLFAAAIASAMAFAHSVRQRLNKVRGGVYVEVDAAEELAELQDPPPLTVTISVPPFITAWPKFLQKLSL